MLWRRYRSAILLAVPAGVAVGAILSLSLYLVGNPDFRTQGGWAAFALLVATGAVIGGVTAFAGLLGGTLFLLFADRNLRRPARVRVQGGAGAAATAASLLWLAIGLFEALSTSDGAAWFPWFVIFAALAAAGTGAAAAFFLRRGERSEMSRTESAATSSPSASGSPSSP